MPIDIKSTDANIAEDVAAALETLYQEVCFSGETYVTSIDPAWLTTPDRRGQLWEMVERLVELEAKAWTTTPRSAQKEP